MLDMVNIKKQIKVLLFLQTIFTQGFFAANFKLLRSIGSSIIENNNNNDNNNNNNKITNSDNKKTNNFLIAKAIYLDKTAQYFVTYSSKIKNIDDLINKNCESRYSVHRLSQDLYILLIKGKSPITNEGDARVIRLKVENKRLIFRIDDENGDAEKFWKLFVGNQSFGEMVQALAQDSEIKFTAIEWKNNQENEYPKYLNGFKDFVTLKDSDDSKKEEIIEINFKKQKTTITIPQELNTEAKTIISSIVFQLSPRKNTFDIQVSRAIKDKLLEFIPSQNNNNKSKTTNFSTNSGNFNF